MVRRSFLDKIFRELRQINNRLTDIERDLKPQQAVITVSALDGLPDHLRKTIKVFNGHAELSAQDVSVQTGRCRALESNYLNQLVRLSLVKKRRSGRKATFYIANSLSAKHTNSKACHNQAQTTKTQQSP